MEDINERLKNIEETLNSCKHVLDLLFSAMMTKLIEDKCKEEQKELMIKARLVPKVHEDKE